MGGGKGGGQVTGYRYYLGMHIVGALAPIDGLMEMLGEKKLLWRGYRRDGQIKVKKGKAYGGEKKQGGFSGRIDLLTGDDTQGSNDYLEERFDAPEVGYRGVFSMVFRRPYIGANNPYLKPLKFKLKSVYRPYGDWLRGYAGVNGEFQNGGAQLFIALDTRAYWMPSIGIACCTFQCGLAVAGNPYGRARPLDGLRSEISVFHVVVLSFERNGIRPPQCLEEFECFVGARSAVMKVLIQNFELFFEPADTETKHKTPLSQLIDFSDLFRNFERVVHRQYHDTGAEF